MLRTPHCSLPQPSLMRSTGGMKWKWTWWFSANFWVFVLRIRSSKQFFSNVAAPTKLVPQSEYRSDTRPLRDINLVRDAIKASAVRSVTTSKCTAFVARHMKRQMYTFKGCVRRSLKISLKMVQRSLQQTCWNNVKETSDLRAGHP